jgi:hypothetical protein
VFPTVEVRWFYQGAVSSEVLEWFEQGERAPEEQPCRVDYYLRLSDRDSLGIKLREGRIEVKQRHRQYGVFRFHDRVTGLVEHWRKWSFELSEGAGNLTSTIVPASCWIGVTKRRKLRRYRLTGNKKIVAVPVGLQSGLRCNLELTRIIVDETEWWSLGFEASCGEVSYSWRSTSLLLTNRLPLTPRLPTAIQSG